MEWLATPLRFDGSAKWLLLDAAMLDQNTIRKLTHKSARFDLHNVFANSRYAAYGNAAPFLIRLDQLDPSVQSKALKTLLEITSGLPILSAIEARADLAVVCRCLVWLAETKTDDGLALYCRFADTRIGPPLLQALDPQQFAHVSQVIRQWQVVNRLGLLDNIFTIEAAEQFPTNGPIYEDVLPFVLTDRQYIFLMQAAETDEIFHMLCEGSPELVPEEDRGEFHQRVARIVGHARKRMLEDGSDIFQFTVIALSTQDRFDAHPMLNDSWEQLLEHRKNFSILVASWSDEVWEALSQSIPSRSRENRTS